MNEFGIIAAAIPPEAELWTRAERGENPHVRVPEALAAAFGDNGERNDPGSITCLLLLFLQCMG